MAHADLLVRSSPPPHVHEKRLGEAQYWVVVVVISRLLAVHGWRWDDTEHPTPILSLNPDS